MENLAEQAIRCLLCSNTNGVIDILLLQLRRHIDVLVTSSEYQSVKVHYSKPNSCCGNTAVSSCHCIQCMPCSSRIINKLLSEIYAVEKTD